MKPQYNTGIINFCTTTSLPQFESFVRSYDTPVTHICIANSSWPLQNNLNFQGIQIVEHYNSLLQDDSVSNIIFFNPSKADLTVVAEFLKANKQIQIIHS